MSKTRLIRSILWLLLFIQITSYAQVEFLGDPSEILSASTGVQFYSRTLKGDQNEESIQQWVIPLFSTSRWLRDDLHINVSQTLSTAQLEDQPSLSGLESTKVRATYRLSENALTYFGFSLPITGADSDVETARTNNLLYAEALQFGVSRITEGTDLDVGFAYARPMGNLSVGLGAGYILKGSYDRIQGTNPISFDPGDALSLSITGLFRTELINLRGKILFNLYGDDTLGENRFESGNDLTFLAAGTFRFEPLHLTLFLADTIKGESVSEQAGISVNNPFDNRLNAGIGLIYSLMNERLLLKTRASLKRFFDEGETNMQVDNLSGGFQYFLTDSLALDVSIGLLDGKMDTGQTDISGYNLNFLAHYGF